MRTLFNPGQPLVTPDGKVTDQGRTLLLLLAQCPLYDGFGSPEGVVDAPAKSLYMDRSGTANTILWVKRDDTVGGDASQGWILS
jgi:hypothetical protein